VMLGGRGASPLAGQPGYEDFAAKFRGSSVHGGSGGSVVMRSGKGSEATLGMARGASSSLTALGMRGSFALKRDTSAPGFERAAGCLNAPVNVPTDGPLAKLWQQPPEIGSPEASASLDADSPGGSPFSGSRRGSFLRTVRSPKTPMPPPAEMEALFFEKQAALKKEMMARRAAKAMSPLSPAMSGSPTHSVTKVKTMTSARNVGFSGLSRSESLCSTSDPGTVRSAASRPHSPPRQLVEGPVRRRGGCLATEMGRRRSTVKMDKDDPELAMVVINAAIDEDPSVPHNWRNRSVMRIQTGDLEGALADIAVLKELEAMAEGDWMNSADIKLKKSDYHGVIEDCEHALKHNSYRAKAWLVSGRARLQTNDYEGAAKDLSEGLRLDPAEAQDWAHRAHARLRIGDNTGAFFDCNEAVRLDPRDPLGWFFRAEARINRKDHEGAIADCNKLIRLDEKFGPAFSHRSTAKLHLKDWDGVIEDATQAIKLDPKIATAWGNRGEAKHIKGDWKGAIVDCEKAMSLNQEYPRCMNYCAMSKLNKGFYTASAENARDAIQIEPDYQDARDVLRVALSSQRSVAAWGVPIVAQLREEGSGYVDDGQ